MWVGIEKYVNGLEFDCGFSNVCNLIDLYCYRENESFFFICVILNLCVNLCLD